MINYNTFGGIILSYTGYAGGKFIGNCLALSRYVMPQDPVAVRVLLDDPTDYDYRLNRVLTTLPPRSKLLDWQMYEFGDAQLFGDEFDNWFEKGEYTVDAQPNDVVDKLTNSKFHFLLTDHAGPPYVNNLLKVWPNSQIVRFINSDKFIELALQLKRPQRTRQEVSGLYSKESYNNLKGIDWPGWAEFDKVGYNINQLPSISDDIKKEIATFYPWTTVNAKVTLWDMDNAIFLQDSFLTHMEQLYQQLGFDDFNAELVTKFYQQYWKLHDLT